MVEFDYTPRVAQDTAGLGFVLPLPQMQQGIDVRNANPQTRASQAASMPFYEQAEDIDPTLTYLRDSYIADVQGLNALVQEAVSLGYDPRTIDYQDAQSIEVNKRYREMLEPIKQKEAQLRYAKPVTTRMRQLGQLYDPSIEDISALQGFGGAEDISKAYNQSLTSMGYGQEGLQAANTARIAAQNNITAIYKPYVDRFANNPVLAQSLNTMYQRDLSAMEQALPKAPPKPQRDPIADAALKDQETARAKAEKELQSYLKRTAPQRVGGEIKLGNKVIGTRKRVPFAVDMTPTSTSAFTTESNFAKEGLGDEAVGGRVPVQEPRYDGMEIVAIGPNNIVITNLTNKKKGDVLRFAVMAKGLAKSEVGSIDAYDDPRNVFQFKDEAQATALEQRLSELEQDVNAYNAAWFGTAPTPAAQPALSPAGKTNLKSTETPR